MSYNYCKEKYPKRGSDKEYFFYVILNRRLLCKKRNVTMKEELVNIPLEVRYYSLVFFSYRKYPISPICYNSMMAKTLEPVLLIDGVTGIDLLLRLRFIFEDVLFERYF